jgi:hypothetical protein
MAVVLHVFVTEMEKKTDRRPKPFYLSDLMSKAG